MASLLRRLFGNRHDEEYSAGIALYNQGRFEEAIAHFEAAVAGSAKTSTTYRLGIFYAAEAHANIGRALLKAEHYDEARVHLEQALTETPNFPDLQYSLGVALFMEGRRDEAKPCFERALEINPDYAEARCFLAVALEADGDAEAARAQLQQVTASRAEIPIQVNRFLLANLRERETVLPEVGPVLELLESGAEFREVYAEGVAQFNLGNYPLAADLLQQAGAMKPHYADVQCQLGLARLKCGRGEGAIQALRTALTVNPRFMEASYFLGLALLGEERYLEAEESLDFARELGGESSDLLLQLARCRFQLGRNEGAETLLDELLRRQPEHAEARYLLGLLRHAEGRHDDALRLIRAALEAKPTLGTAALDLALIHARKGEWGRAGLRFRHLAEAAPEDPQLLGFLGQTQLAQGDLEAALMTFTHAQELAPQDLYVLKGRLRCELRLGRYAKAQALLAPALTAHPSYPDLLKLQGDLHFKQGDFLGAEESYRRALSQAPQYLEAELGLALTLRNLGRNDAARAMLEPLLAAHPDQPALRRLLAQHFELLADEGD
ncbi:tetratricopeptide repeat protein [bacterium]|nr:tetratricopeptide repeat protein [bacterium]